MAAFNNGVLLGSSTTVGGLALMPHLAGYAILRYGVVVAISGGVIVVLSQIILTLYRYFLRH